jgi:hypothetical protein
MLCVRAAARGRFYSAAIVSVPLVIAASSQADAASYYYWNDSQPVIISPVMRPDVVRKPKARHVQKALTVDKAAAKPQGPLTLAVSINKQQLKVYDANRDEGTFHADGRVQRHPEAEIPSLEYLQRRADAVHAAHHLVGNSASRRRAAGLSGVAWLHPHACELCDTHLWLDADGFESSGHAR